MTFNKEFGMTDEEIQKEADRLGWDVDYLKSHWRKENRILKMSENKNKCRECGKELNPVQAILSASHGICGECTRKKHREAIR